MKNSYNKAMKNVTLICIPHGSETPWRLSFPRWFLKALLILSFLAMFSLGYMAWDYSELKSMRSAYGRVKFENEHLRSEARLLLSDLGGVGSSLQKVEDYTKKIQEILEGRLRLIEKKTGTPIGIQSPSPKASHKSESLLGSFGWESLIFRPTFQKLAAVRHQSDRQILELQELWSYLNQKKSLLDTIPMTPPIQGWLSSPFGVRMSPITGKKVMHNGVDLASAPGTPIYATASGMVLFSGYKPGYGNFVSIAHYGASIETRYAHNEKNLVKAGQLVKRGDQIASLGASGNARGPHVHYEVYVGGRPQDPQKFMVQAPWAF